MEFRKIVYPCSVDNWTKKIQYFWLNLTLNIIHILFSRQIKWKISFIHLKWYNWDFFKLLTSCLPHILTFQLGFIMISSLDYLKFLFINVYRFLFSVMIINLFKYLNHLSSTKCWIIGKYWWLIDSIVIGKRSIGCLDRLN